MWRGILKKADDFRKRGPCLLGIGKPSELALRLLDRYPDLYSVYDGMDDFPEFYEGLSRSSMAHRKRQIVRRATMVMVSSTALFRRFQSYRSDVVLVKNGFDSMLLSGANPVAQRDTPAVLGYVGTMGSWFDWEWISSLAKGRPDLCVRLIGPMHSRPSLKIPANVERHPECSHVEAVKEMRKFSVGLIPFRRTVLTESVDPIKYYEYRALGLPVLSTKFGEMVFKNNKPGVFLSDSATDAVNLLHRILDYKSTEKNMAAFQNENSWDSRFDAAGIPL